MPAARATRKRSAARYGEVPASPVSSPSRRATRNQSQSQASVNDEGGSPPKRGRPNPRGGAARGGGASSSQTSTSARQGGAPADVDSEEEGDSAGFQFTQGEPERWVAHSQQEAMETADKDENAWDKLEEMEQKNLVQKMMRFLLFKGMHKDPISKKDMMSEVLGKEYRGRKVLKKVINLASDALEKTVGYQLVSVPEDRREKKSHPADVFYLVNCLATNAEHARDLLREDDDAGARGLLMVVLSLILCNADREVEEELLFKRLNALDERMPTAEEMAALTGNGSKMKKPRPVHIEGLGDPHVVLQMLVKQHYLQKRRKEKPGSEGAETVGCYSMGARSYLEVGRRQVIQFMAESLDQTVDRAALEELSDEDESDEEDEEEEEEQ